MKSKNDSDLQMVEKNHDSTDEIIDQIMEELKDEDGAVADLEERIASYKKKVRTRIGIAVAVILVVVIGGYMIIRAQTYTAVSSSGKVAELEAENGNYVQFAKGVLRYSREGIVLLDYEGQEKWNHPCQIQHPIVDIAGESAVVADQGGNMIMVFDEKGIRGEIKTTLPIEKVSVSKQGITAAIVKDGETPQVICYDTAGNVLAEHRSSVSGMGYPLDIALSPSGELLMVSYLYTAEGSVSTRIIGFNFGEAGKKAVDNQVLQEDYDGAVMPMIFFDGEATSVVVGDAQILIYKGEGSPKLAQEIKLKQEVKGAFKGDDCIGLILRHQGKSGYELRLYGLDGRELLSADFIGEYNNVKMVDNQIIMYEETKCLIYTKSGQKRFEGEMENSILNIFPISGFNKYLMMSTNGFYEIRLVK